jgi:hypothetical protein
MFIMKNSKFDCDFEIDLSAVNYFCIKLRNYPDGMISKDDLHFNSIIPDLVRIKKIILAKAFAAFSKSPCQDYSECKSSHVVITTRLSEDTYMKTTINAYVYRYQILETKSIGYNLITHLDDIIFIYKDPKVNADDKLQNRIRRITKPLRDFYKRFFDIAGDLRSNRISYTESEIKSMLEEIDTDTLIERIYKASVNTISSIRDLFIDSWNAREAMDLQSMSSCTYQETIPFDKLDLKITITFSNCDGELYWEVTARFTDSNTAPIYNIIDKEKMHFLEEKKYYESCKPGINSNIDLVNKQEIALKTAISFIETIGIENFDKISYDLGVIEHYGQLVPESLCRLGRIELLLYKDRKNNIHQKKIIHPIDNYPLGSVIMDEILKIKKINK